MSKDNHLSKEDVAHIMSTGAVLHAKKITIFVKKNTCKKIRFGCSVPKKQFTKATQRNYIKRRMITALREASKHLSHGYDYFVIYKGDEKPVVKTLTEEFKKALCAYRCS